MSDTETIDRFIPVPDGHIFTRTWPRGEGDPIVLLHDSLGCVELWGKFPAALSEATGRTVIAYDRLGYGRSSSRHEPPSRTFITDEADIYFPLIREALGFDRFFLFGHSVGGGMSIAIASRFEESCRGAISESAQAFIEELTLEGVRIAKKRFENPKALAKLERLHGDKARWVLEAWTETWLSSEFADWSLIDLLPRVTCQLLIIHGERDDFGSSAFPEFIRDHAGGETHMMVLPDSGHIPHRENPGLILDITCKFLAKA